MAWKQLRITLSRDSVASVEAALEELEALSITLQDDADEAILEPALGETPLWQQTALSALFDSNCDTRHISQALVAKFPLLREQLDWESIEDKDWEREWMQDYEAIQCADKFWICPSWKQAPDPFAINLILDPGLAFGTGTHPTTFQCLQWLAAQNLQKKTIIDFGCGSGILAIAALLLGADRAQGIDIDPQALLASAENLQRNHLPSDRLRVYLPEHAPESCADIVVANILAGPLVELAEKLCAKINPGGSICLSGILVNQKNAIVDAYSKYINLTDIFEKDGWLCICGSKKD